MLEGNLLYSKFTDLIINLTNLDSIFKSRDITLPTKVRLVKAMVFPAVMYECENCTVKKAEREALAVCTPPAPEPSAKRPGY